MTHLDFRSKYPKFKYENYSYRIEKGKLICEFKYSISELNFTHTVTFENLQKTNSPINRSLIFHLGLAEMFSYWKLTCSPTIELTTNNLQLTTDQLNFWKKLLINGMGQYFYENQIDFTPPDFLRIINASQSQLFAKSPQRQREPAKPKSGDGTQRVLVPIGGGKDSIVTLELLKKDFDVIPIIVEPTTIASYKIIEVAKVHPPIVVRRNLDPQLFQLNKQGFLNGHIPYSAVLAFIFLLAASVENIPFIAVPNEASSSEGNIEYLGHTINHQYSKSLEFEIDFQKYLNQLNISISYFSFLRPLHELQIAKLFSKFPQYFSIFRSCNKNQQFNSWCGHCPKCLSIVMTLLPWTSEQTIVSIFGFNPLNEQSNNLTIQKLSGAAGAKPFECVLTFEEANICLEFINHGQTPQVKEFLSRWGEAPNTPPHLLEILKEKYYN